jgi:hypothetical protein
MFVFITEKEYFIHKCEVIRLFSCTYVDINFQIQNCNDSVVVGMDWRIKCRFHEVTYYFTIYENSQ